MSIRYPFDNYHLRITIIYEMGVIKLDTIQYSSLSIMGCFKYSHSLSSSLELSVKSNLKGFC